MINSGVGHEKSYSCNGLKRHVVKLRDKYFTEMSHLASIMRPQHKIEFVN